MDTKALRQKILDLAIRGKLVPQDPADEPAAVLLERIRAEKQQMVKDGKLKAKDIKNDTVIYVGEDNLHYEKFSDGTVKCIEDEIPFEIPDGWAWARFSNILELLSGQDLTPDRYNDSSIGIPYITGASNLLDGKVVINRWTPSPTTHATAGDLLLTVKGSGVGKMAFFDLPDAHIARQIMALRCNPNIYRLYLAVLVPAIVSNLTSKANGIIPGISRDTILKELVPIPPFAEQKRIYGTVKDLVDLINQIDKKRDLLEETISIVKAKILDLAIRGKLVPQDPADEPASVLLERIRADKEEQIKAGKIKRDKKESFIFRGEDNSYYLSRSTHKEQVDAQFIFPLPPGWQWCTLSNISHFELGKTLDQGKNTGDYYPYLRSANIKWDSIDLSDLKEMRFEKEELERYTIIKNDLLICEGGDVGRCCVWESTDTIMYQNALHRVRFFENCNPFFFMFYMWHYELEGMLKPICNGVTIKHLTGDVLRSIPFALPPVEEQNRIVAKIREYFQVIEVLQ